MTVLTGLALITAAVAMAGFAADSDSSHPLGDFAALGPHRNSRPTGQPRLSGIFAIMTTLLTPSGLRCGFARCSPAPRRSAPSAPYPGRHRPRRGDRSHGVGHPPAHDCPIEMLGAAS
jgi:hypothetical protein